MSKAWDKLTPFFEKSKKLGQIISILNYDISTNTPEEGIADESDILNDFMTESAKISTDPDYIAALEEAIKDESLTAMQKKVVREAYKDVEVFKKMPMEEYTHLMELSLKSNEMWRKYKPLDDFASWLPYWNELIIAFRKYLTYFQKPGQSLYDAALDRYEPGETEEEIDGVFNPLKAYLLKKIPEVLEKQKKIQYRPIKAYSIDKQRHLTFALLDLISYDMKRGCVRESMHPFSDFTGRYDSRVTTKYLESDWRSNAFSVLHEGGHCLEFQNWSDEQFNNFADRMATSTICETHSRFIENIVSRSRAFVPLFKAACAEHLDPEFASWSDEEFYQIINQVKPGANRCESDELTYSLHIIIRYEIERDLINGKIEAKDVPSIWHDKYVEYLGVDEPTDKEGCMQDIHWTDASIGYFPSYALGNLYGAQILNTMKKDFDFEGLIAANKVDVIKKWFADHDYCHDWMDPKDWIKAVTGEALNPQYYLDYLESKF